MRALVMLSFGIAVAACGGGEEPSPYPPMPSGPSTPAFAANVVAPAFGSGSGGAAFGSNASSTPAFGGSASGGGSTSAGPAPRSCTSSSDCGGGLCTGSSGRRGFCVDPCPLEGTALIGKSTCAGAAMCVRADVQSVAVCLQQCTTAADCPSVSGLESECLPFTEGGPTGQFCVWFTPKAGSAG